MNTIDLIAGLFGAVIMGVIVGYVLYRFKVISHRRKVLKNIPKKIEKQNKKDLIIGGVKVEKIPSYIVEGKKVDPGKEIKIQEKEKELEKLKDDFRKLSKQKDKKPEKKKAVKKTKKKK